MRRLTAIAMMMTLTSYSLADNHVHQFEHAGYPREYLIHVPANDSGNALPVVMMLHGAGGSSRVAAKYGWAEKADRENFLAVFPDGLALDPSKPPTFTDNPRIWDDGSGRGNALRKKVDDVGYLKAVLDDVSKRYHVDASSVYCTGFSNGASMTFRLGVEMADRIAAIAPVSGHFWLKNVKLSRPVPMLYLIGTADPLNPINGGDVKTPWGVQPKKPPVSDSINAWVKLLSLDANGKLLSDEDGIRAIKYGPGKDGSEVIVYTVENLGHEWPGAARVLPESMTGPTRTTPVATDLIWSFFSRNRLTAPTTKPTDN